MRSSFTSFATLMAAFLAALALVAWPLAHLFDAVTAGVDPEGETGWWPCALGLLTFNALGVLPSNPQHFGAVGLDTAFDTAVSFVTSTNRQSQSGETTMSPLTQMPALAAQNFFSAAGCGAANAMHDSFTPLGCAVPLVGLLDEVPALALGPVVEHLLRRGAR